MKFSSEHSEGGVTERLFETTVAGEVVPAVVWSPGGATSPRPLLLLGHGGSQHKGAGRLAGLAKRLARDCGFAVAAIDAPLHGDRATPEESARFFASMREQLQRAGGMTGEPVRTTLRYAAQASREWSATLDALQQLEFIGSGGAVGYWGLSLGSYFGIPFVASEPRITAAVFGLAGLGDSTPEFAEAARSIRIPIEFMCQWDDELLPRADGLALFDAFGSAEKTLHVNPGGHAGMPPFEAASWERFFLRHLGMGPVER
ncbi:MAG: alpha/beta hydrolase [Gemmatimonadaceae bacterium]|nr:alpha/beta hydrolase [Gemmatimonadaceae bacterium]